MKKFFSLFFALYVSYVMVAQDANYLTVAQLMQEYNDLNLASGTTASGTYTVRGYVTFWKNGYPQYQNASFYIDDTETGSTTLLQCFRLTGATTADQRTLVVGDYIEVQNAQLTNYYGSAELKNGSFTIISDATPAQYMGATTIANFLSQADLKNSYQLTGVVSGLSAGNNMTYGNLNLTDETGSIYVYGVLDANGQSGNFTSLNIEDGDTLTIRGTYTTYQGNPQIANAQYISHSKYEEVPPQFMGATTIADFLSKADTKNIYQLTVVVNDIDNFNYDKITITTYDADDDRNELSIYGLLVEDDFNNSIDTSLYNYGMRRLDTLTIHAVYQWGDSTYDSNGNKYRYVGVEDAVLVGYSKYIAPPVVYQCGDNVYATKDPETGALILTGTGDMWDNGVSCINIAQTIIVSEGITSIGNYSFINWRDLQSVSLPSTLQRIGTAAFLGCNISSIYIPENVVEIGWDAFYNCPLVAINVSEQNNIYSSQEGVLFDKTKKILYIYPRNKICNTYTIPNSVEKIYHSAFYGNTNIISVSMGNNVQQIGIGAFADCEKLISLTLSNNLTAIGYNSVKETALYNDDREWDNGALYISTNLILGGRFCPNDPCPVDENGEIHCPEENDCQDIYVDSIYAIKEGTRLIATEALKGDWIQKLTIPSSVEYVNPDAFVQSTLEEVVWNAKHCHDFIIETLISVNGIEKDSTIIYNPFVSYETYNSPTNKIKADRTMEVSSVKKISFAKDVEYLPADLCSVMPTLEEVYNYNPEPIIVSENMFEDVSYTCILYVPKGSKEKYEAAPVWQDFYRIREMEGSEAIENIGKEDEASITKIIHNGQILIRRGDKTYSVTGVEVK